MKINAAVRLKAYNTAEEVSKIRKDIAALVLKVAEAKEAGKDTRALVKQLETMKQKLSYANRR